MDPHLPLKKPKLEEESNPIIDLTTTNGSHSVHHQEPKQNEAEDGEEEGEQEEALIALIAHRSHEVEHNKQRFAYYKSQVELSERRLRESQSQLARLRSRRSAKSAAAAAANGSPSKSRPQPRPQLIIPPANTRNQSPAAAAAPRVPPPAKPAEKVKREPVTRPLAPLSSEKKRPKRMLEQKEHQDLIPSIRGSSSPCTISFQGSTHISSQHKRKLRSLVASPVNDLMFVTR